MSNFNEFNDNSFNDFNDSFGSDPKEMIRGMMENRVFEILTKELELLQKQSPVPNDLGMVNTTSEVTDCDECDKASMVIVHRDKLEFPLELPLSIPRDQIPRVYYYTLSCECEGCGKRTAKVVVHDSVIKMVDEFYEAKKAFAEAEADKARKEAEEVQEAWTDQFVAALEADLIMPEDFGMPGTRIR